MDVAGADHVLKREERPLEELGPKDGLDYNAAGRKWVGWLRAHLDADSGVMPAQISFSGPVIEGPRGCALSWSLAFMPEFAPEFAAEQYARYRKEWALHRAGLVGIRERVQMLGGKMSIETAPGEVVDVDNALDLSLARAMLLHRRGKQEGQR